MVPFVSTGDLGEYLGQDVNADQLAVIALDSACEIIRAYCGQRLNYLANDTITLNGNGRSVLLLPELPAVEVSAVTEDDVLLETTDYYATRSGLLYRTSTCGWWSSGIQNIDVTYSHGYAVLESDVEDDPTDDVPLPDRMPSDIRRVALSLARRLFVASGSVAETGTKASETIKPDEYSYTNATTSASGTGTITISSSIGLGEDEKLILDLHRHARVA